MKHYCNRRLISDLYLLLKNAVYSTFQRLVHCTNERGSQGYKPSDRKGTIKRELDLIGELEQIRQNQSAIMFWRPQKVGSSTILSLLTSFGYRYNAPPRRKTPLTNSLCLKMAVCALHESNNTNNNKIPDKTSTETQAYLKGYIGNRSFHNGGGHPVKTGTSQAESNAESQNFMISTTHQVCNLRADVIKLSLQCSFSNISDGFNNAIGGYPTDNTRGPSGGIKELFVVRDPLSRAISVYYFWGELYKMHHNVKRRSSLRGTAKPEKTNRLLLANEDENFESKDDAKEVRNSCNFYSALFRDLQVEDFGNDTRQLSRQLSSDSVIRLGGGGAAQPVRGNLFTYHGDESTVPPFDIAMAFATKLPYNAGMPGPSFTWSVFSNTPDTAIAEIKSDRMVTIVTERLAESLVVASHYFGWSLADMVVAAARKALSTHPKHAMWPPEAVNMMKSTLTGWKEYDVYNAATRRLDQSIQALKTRGIDFAEELRTLKVMQTRVSKLCMSEEYLVLYRDKLEQEGYVQHHSNNKLRDTDEKFNREGHCFSFNNDIMYSYDICGNCEAHAMLFAVKSGLAATIDVAPTLSQIDRKLIQNNPDFAKCPVR